MPNLTLAAGKITNADQLTIELVTPPDTPPAVFIRWPLAPSVVAPTPKAIANLTAALVRTLAEAQSKLAAIRAAGRLRQRRAEAPGVRLCRGRLCLLASTRDARS